MTDKDDAPASTPPLRRLGSLRTLWPFVRRHSGLFTAWLLALAVSSAATLSLPPAVKQMIDHGFSSGGQINRAFALLMLVAVVMALGTAARFYFVSLLGEKVVADLRSQLYAHLIQLGAGFHDRSRSGELVSRLTADTELLRSVVGSTMSVALRSSVTVVGSLAMLFVTSPRLAAWSLLGIPLAVLPIIIGARKLRTVARNSQDRIADANSLASETLGAVRTVQAHAREPYERGRFDHALGDAIKAARRRIGAQSLVTASAILLVFGAIVGVLWLGAHDVIDGRLSAGTLGQFVLYALIGGGSVGALAEVWNELQRAAGGMGRIGELLQEDIEIRAPAQPHALPQLLRGEIQFDDVVFHYPQRPDQAALDHFSLHVQPGETVALVGPSGAGKSTVLSMLLRFHDPASGRVCVDGVDVRQADPAELRAQLALVPQQPTLFAASARENIRYGRLQASDDEVEQAARAAEADGFLRALPQGYDSELGERGARLSGGQQQRVAIARALLKDAPILLLDEATSALDAQSEYSVQQALERLMAGRTTLVIAHRLATVLKADRIVVMDQGRIVAEGTHAQLLAEGGLYAELARLQFID
ncbi:TPA: ABC transporter transmembrane domain-containing protein [Stenotrophomonas maltophilia]|uniref:ABC transporter transmembrane domain-containing protein n=1 Tax=Stenotrophomonas maltophilia TaxID=40324 RepID=A0AAJ2MU77_STEMA|nr:MULTISPECIES: ABC transporter transmembrane domain-containing protein [Stenotrophomonas]MBH1365391.1 ATP-binding cassette domain-containing protein [Stenotrophomonas maltophilia]MDQ7283276.1 ABC transporter transmembrane domain-containing protein [Stenotrophomonas sp. Sm6012]MDT3468315.1 ABC transporter transmembrane domain-containing protein [Stenotrophomonas maltophilia]HDS1125274.1 ATP-binding cassette domain-containing protein [Stenotrophomonas maltophilia]HEL3181477.1 ATP-binding casse